MQEEKRHMSEKDVRLNVTKLIKEMGGHSTFAALVGKPRTAPYRWEKSGRISSEVLEKIKVIRPELDLDYFFEPEEK